MTSVMADLILAFRDLDLSKLAAVGRKNATAPKVIAHLAAEGAPRTPR